MNTYYLLNQHRDVAELQAREDVCIASLDPLQADFHLKKLPELNKKADVEGLRALCYSLLPHPDLLEAFDYYEAAAAMRDLGFFLGSMKRHGAEPVALIPELDYVLDVLGSKTALPPRDTLLHYTSWNPEGLRQRTYTGTPDEDHLIRSVRMGMVPLLKAIYGLERLLHIALDNVHYVAECEQIAQNFEALVQGIIHARRNVSTDYFANELRMYFDAIQLHGKVYLGPGAVEMPMFVYDHLLWSSQNTDPSYNEFKETYLPYVLSFLRDTYQQQNRQPSVLDKACSWVYEQEFRTPQGEASLKALHKLCMQLKSFRMPHKKVADEAYDKDKQKRAHGSGGYTTDILSQIIQHTQQAVKKRDDAYAHYCSLPLA